MGRRKKEPRSVHREHIAAAASALFMAKGIEAVSMEDIAKAAGYSKATLYVYFENKEEIVGLLVADSMQKLYDYIAAALAEQEATRGRYDLICRSLVRYQQEFPFYFEMALAKINVDEEQEAYQAGEAINAKLAEFLVAGMARGDLRDKLAVLPTILNFWGMLVGVIKLAAEKEEYIQRATGMGRQEFLAYGFDMLYRAIAREEA